MRAVLLALLVVLTAVPEKKSVPVKRLDRTKAVGAPVLDDKTNEGFYVWLEDGWFNVAAVARSKAKRQMRLEVRSTKKIEKSEGAFSARVQEHSVVLSASVGAAQVKGRFKTEGDITVSTTHPLFVGPLSRKAASTVSIGRY